MDNPGMPNRDFEDFLIERNDELDNAAYELTLNMLCLDSRHDNERKFPWNMEIIGSILEHTQQLLEAHGYPACWPYHENDMPCYQTASCKKEGCLMKGQSEKEGESNETN